MKYPLLKEAMDLYDLVQKDNAEADECLRNTGPGESPYSFKQREFWEERTAFFKAALLIARDEIAELYKSTQP